MENWLGRVPVQKSIRYIKVICSSPYLCIVHVCIPLASCFKIVAGCTLFHYEQIQ